MEEDRKNGIRISFIGSREGIPADIRLLMKQVERIGRKEDRIMLNIAVNYGGRPEIVRAARQLAQQVAEGTLKPEDITDEGTKVLAKEVAKRIEKELEYPGQIRVNVIRETRSTEYAK